MKLNLHETFLLSENKKFTFYLTNGSIITGEVIYITPNGLVADFNNNLSLGNILKFNNDGNFDCLYLINAQLNNNNTVIKEILININEIIAIF